MQFFLSTDGYLDQNGGDKGFPFGKKKFSEIITNNQNLSLKEILIVYAKRWHIDAASAEDGVAGETPFSQENRHRNVGHSRRSNDQSCKGFDASCRVSAVQG
jgi:hypothetical protein